MDIITIDQMNRLFWLGRYTERVYTTISLFIEYFDKTLDDEAVIGEFCQGLDIPNIYHGHEDFRVRYCFDAENADSIYSNLQRAYDNAIVLREEVGSEPLSYIQLAVYALNRGATREASIIDLMKVKDNILAFWGIVDDQIESEYVRNIIKIGKRVERIDLYARHEYDRSMLLRELHRLTGRINRTGLKYNPALLNMLEAMIELPNMPYDAVVQAVDSLVEV